MRARHKKWVTPFLEEHPDIALTKVIPTESYFQSEKLYLEIGIGKGDFILNMAAKRPGNYLGLERDNNVTGIAVKKLLEEGTPNVKVREGDFDDIAEEMKGLKFDIIFLNFSDPWPKKRHGKRRLTYAPRLEKIASFLKEDGEIRIKTDNLGLYEFTLEQAEILKLHKVFDTTDYQFDDSDDAMSEYERNFREKGQRIYRLVYKK